ncbi:hypothetical protein [Kitasatospora sp. NPDC087315]|uniref:hypothetical protein n=1 Tax=Kitasatospora sp. NPDC087315 TaxID=3364069 RepID=UPI003818A63F
MTTITPNPPSPYATADPNLRHTLAPPNNLLGRFRTPASTLALTDCRALAVVPNQPYNFSASPVLPDGLCTTCIATWIYDEPAPAAPLAQPCERCDALTQHGTLCAVCRIDAHDRWTADGCPSWEATYEPGNISTFHLGWHHTPHTARAAARAWFWEQHTDTHTLLWYPVEPGTDNWYEANRINHDGTESPANLIIRRLRGTQTAA